MTQDEIIEMWKNSGDLEIVGMPYSKIEAFAKLVALRYEKKIADLGNIISQRHWDVLQEREACAKIADEWAVGWPHPSKVIAKEIRARGQA